MGRIHEIRFKSEMTPGQLIRLLEQNMAELGPKRLPPLKKSKRLLAVTSWATQQKELKNLNVGYFGASTGAAAALSAPIRAVVSRGGRPDLVRSPFSQVQAPTLLIVGSLDAEVLELNRWAYKNLRCEKQLADVPGASHLFIEPGSLETVAVLASHWFEKYLAAKT